LVGLVGAVLLRRPDLVVLISPFALAAAFDWSPPRHEPALETRAIDVSREGEAVEVERHVLKPGPGTLVLASGGVDGVEVATLTVGVEPAGTVREELPWGVHDLAPRHAYAATAWGGWVAAVRCEPRLVTVLPRRDVPILGTLPHPAGHGPGPHPGQRPGDGTDFAGLRPLLDGEPARRIHWPASLRTGRLVTQETHQDTTGAYLVILDAAEAPLHDEVVRAAAGLCTQLIQDGAYVALAVHGCGDIPPVRLGSGPRHLTRLELSLAAASPRPGDPANDHQPRRIERNRYPLGTVVIVLTGLADEALIPTLVRLRFARRRVTVIDTAGSGASHALDRLERRVRRLHLESRGIPVTPWTTPSASVNTALLRLRRAAS